MTTSQLEPMVKTQEAMLAAMQKQLDATIALQQQMTRDLTGLQVALGKFEQRLTDHIAHVEKWDGRRWAMIAAIAGGLIVNVVMLLINKKS